MSRTTNKTRSRRAPAVLGTVEQLPSGRFRALYRHHGQRFTAPHTFDSREAATGWLASERAERSQGTWRDPRLGLITLTDYATGWLDGRTDLAPRTRDLYRRLLDARVLPEAGTAEAGRLALGRLTLAALTPALIRTWFGRMSADCARDAARPRKQRPADTKHGQHPARAWAIANGYPVAARGRLPRATVEAWEASGQPEDAPTVHKARTGRTTAAQAYRLLHAILATAVTDGLIVTNPAQVKGAGIVRHAERETATPDEVAQLALMMPPHLSAAVHLAAWSGLRRGELLGLARQHVDLDAGTVRVIRALGADRKIGTVKTRSSARLVYLPRPIVEHLADHLDRYTDADPDALVFTNTRGGPVYPPNLLAAFSRARQAIGRPNLTWHDLRHTGATLAYSAGASVRDVQDRLGHTTNRAASIYAHAADDSGRRIADALAAKYWPEPTNPTPPTAPDAATTAAPSDSAPADTAPAVRDLAANSAGRATRRAAGTGRPRHLSLVPAS